MTSSPKNASITQEQVLNLFKLNPLHVKIIDVRSRDEYQEKHIEGALHISLDELANKGNIFDQNDHLITVCGKGGGRSMQGAETLSSLSYKNVFWLEGGTFGWF